MRVVLGAAAVLGLAGCWPEEDRSDVGYDDGYTVGYNTTCEIRTTLIHGEWENTTYAEGYANGMADGIAACLADRQN